MTCLGSRQRAGQLLELGRSYRVITTSLGQTSAEVVVAGGYDGQAGQWLARGPVRGSWCLVGPQSGIPGKCQGDRETLQGLVCCVR